MNKYISLEIIGLILYLCFNVNSSSTNNFLNNNDINMNEIKNNNFALCLVSSLQNKITKNNFINNEKTEESKNSFFNQWGQNYWDQSLSFLKKINHFYFIQQGPNPDQGLVILLLKFDFFPAKEPYSIGV